MNFIVSLFKTIVVVIIAAFVLLIAAWSGHIITFVLSLMAVGVLTFVMLYRPEDS